MDDRFERYVTELFAAEDPILSKIRARHAAENLPAINVSPEEGKLLYVLLHAIQAKRVLEIGALGGYSGVWLARALPPGFDAVFIDADKEPLPKYFDWGMKLLRRGGLLLSDNAFFHGAAVDPNDRSPNALGVRAFNELAARDPRLAATIIPVRDGLVVGVKIRDSA